jgi:hypothetical protein
LNNRTDSEFPVFVIIPVLGMAGAIGVLRRKRWGVVSFLVSQAALVMLTFLLQDSDDPMKPLLRSIAPMAGIGINVWYFGRRWRLLSRPSYEDQSDPVTAFEESGEADQRQPPEALS